MVQVPSASGLSNDVLKTLTGLNQKAIDGRAESLKRKESEPAPQPKPKRTRKRQLPPPTNGEMDWSK